MSENIVNIEHEQWLQNPVTRRSRELLEKHVQTIVSALADNSMNVGVDAEHVRRLAVQLKTTKAISNLLYDTETFVKVSSSK